MATVKAFIRTSSKKKERPVAVRFRLSDGRKAQLYYKSDITVNPDCWDDKKECIKMKILFNRIERVNFARAVVEVKDLMLNLYERIPKKSKITSEEFAILIDQSLHPEKYDIVEEEVEDKDFFDHYLTFMQVKEYFGTEKKNYSTLMRLLKRFELYVSVKRKKKYELQFDSLDVGIVRELEYFIRNEYLYIDKPVYKIIYEELPEKRMPKLRGRNTVLKIMNRFRTFVKWAIAEQLLANDPFIGYEMKSPRYGTPYYISIEERTIISTTNLSEAWENLPEDKRKTINKSLIPQLEIQRDIFIFHCMVGCRVGDLVNFTPNNIINGHLSYIARKERVESIEVPLNQAAMAIVLKYRESQQQTNKLLPFISPQKYNDSIKMIFLLCGLTRNVTIWNSTIGREEQHPLNELASSHLARRTFIGNLYKKVQDPNMIGKLSGHVEGSRAFARYRTIDDDMKKSLVNMLE